MRIYDRKTNIAVELLSMACLKRPCYTPQLAMQQGNLHYVCGRRTLHGCPVMYLTEEKIKKEKEIMIINKTPHPINIIENEVTTRRFPPIGEPIRLAVSAQPCPEIDGIRTVKTVFGKPENLPAEKDGVFYIVSQIVKSALPGRDDLLVPAEVQRDDKGRIIGCKSLGR